MTIADHLDAARAITPVDESVWPHRLGLPGRVMTEDAVRMRARYAAHHARMALQCRTCLGVGTVNIHGGPVVPCGHCHMTGQRTADNCPGLPKWAEVICQWTVGYSRTADEAAHFKLHFGHRFRWLPDDGVSVRGWEPNCARCGCHYDNANVRAPCDDTPPCATQVTIGPDADVLRAAVADDAEGPP